MKHKLNDAMDHISDAFIADAAAQINKARGAAVPPNPRPRPWLGAVAAVLVLALIGALLFPVFNALDPNGGTNPPVLQSPTTNGPTIGTTRPSIKPTTSPTIIPPTTIPTTKPGTIRPTSAPSSTKPITVSLTTDKTVYLFDEPISFTLSPVSMPNRLTLERVDGQWMQSYDNVDASFSISFGWVGEYRATFTAPGISNPAIAHFTVIEGNNDGAPTYATIRVDKSVYKLGDTVNFLLSSDCDFNRLWIYKPDGSYEFVDTGNTFSYNPSMVGQYQAMIEVGIGTTLLASDKIVFQVIDPNHNCNNGHTYMNGVCIYCNSNDPSYTCANGHFFQGGYYCHKCGAAHPCANGHTFENGFCVNCDAVDPDYDHCASGHTFQRGYCIYCSEKDPDYDFCANGHTYRDGQCIYCEKEDPYYNPCAYGHSYSNGVCTNCGSPMPGTGDTSMLEEEYGATLKIMIPGHNPKDTYAWQNTVVSQFKSYYPNVTVQFVTATWNDWYEKMMASYVSGDPIDLIYDSVNNQPKLAITGVTQPLQNYINMDNPNLKMSAMDECFKYGGNYYVAASEVNYGVIFYNKDMFQAAGLDDPMDLYKNGQWNWTNFTALAKALTDKDAGIYGFATEFPYLFYGANATSTLKLDANGNYSLNMDDPAFIAALEIIQDGEYESGWSGFDLSAMGSFQNGTAAMLGSFTMYESEINALPALFGWDLINYGVVPMPYGPHNTQKLNMVHASGWSIGAGSDCPYHVGKLIDMLVDGQAKEQTKLPAASRELYAEMADNVFCVNTRDSGINGGYELAQEVARGKSIAQAIEEYKPQYQAMIKQYTTNG